MLVLAGACGPSEVSKGRRVELVELESVDIVRRLRETGTVAARALVPVRAPLGGTVIALAAREGERVAAGEVLATVELEPAERIRYLGTRVTVLQDSLALAGAVEEQTRKTRLAGEGRVSEMELELAAAEVEVLRAKLELGRVQLRAIEGQSGGARRVREGRADLLAPIDGTVLRRSVEVGEVVAPKAGVVGAGRELFLIGDIDPLEVHCRVDQADVRHVRLGAAVRVRVDALPEAPLSGVVGHLSPAAVDARDGGERVEFEARIDLVDPPAEVRPGMTCRIDLVLAEAHGVPGLPVESVRAVASGGWEVVLPESGGTVAVELGLRDEHRVEIKSGLSVGDRVVRYPVGSARGPDLPDSALLGRVGAG